MRIHLIQPWYKNLLVTVEAENYETQKINAEKVPQKADKQSLKRLALNTLSSLLECTLWYEKNQKYQHTLNFLKWWLEPLRHVHTYDDMAAWFSDNIPKKH